MAATPPTGSAATPTRQVEAFNRAHPVGTRVRFWPGGKDDGPGRTGTVKEPGAFVLSGHTAVVFITGHSSCVAISHVEGDA